jgi:hypothetical protein
MFDFYFLALLIISAIYYSYIKSYWWFDLSILCIVELVFIYNVSSELYIVRNKRFFASWQEEVLISLDLISSYSFIPYDFNKSVINSLNFLIIDCVLFGLGDASKKK